MLFLILVLPTLCGKKNLTSFLNFQRKRPVQKVEMGTSNQNDVDMSWIPQETLNQISK